MRIHILTLFPEMFIGPFEHSIIARAQKNQLVAIHYHNLRQWGIGPHKVVDGKPFGGGSGMIIRVDVVAEALEEIQKLDPKTKKILLDPSGKLLDQARFGQWSKLDSLTLVCGHYEGMDERIREYLVDEIWSVGNYVLTGGEIAAVVVVDAVVRLIPGVLEKTEAITEESFSLQTPKTRQQKILEYPQYTRPQKFASWSVPQVLLSGNHQAIDKWRQQEAIKRTKQWRPELLKDQ
jgi:tRNA (guanine37-N1)-methyltransferase